MKRTNRREDREEFALQGEQKEYKVVMALLLPYTTYDTIFLNSKSMFIDTQVVNQTMKRQILQLIKTTICLISKIRIWSF